MANWLTDNIFSFLFSAAVVGFAIPQILSVAHKKKLFDSIGERKVHHGAVPRLGGVSFAPSIMLSVLLVLAWGMTGGKISLTPILVNDFKGMMLLFCGMLCLYLVGLADDLVEVRYRSKFVIQILVGILVVRAGVVIDNLYGFAGIYALPEWIAWPLTLLVIVYIINAYNLIDGLDGLSGSLAILPMLFYGYVCYTSGHQIYSMVAFAASGCLIPFLYFNIFGSAERKTKIFMGDTGALTNGLVVGFLGIEMTEIGNFGTLLSDINPIVLAISPLVVPMFDQLRVFFHRIVRKRNPFLPDKCHIHHKLLDLGLSTGAVRTWILTVAVLFIVVNLLLAAIPLQLTWIILIDFTVWTVGNMILTSAIRRRERRLSTDLYK